MPRTKTIIKKSAPALRSAPLPGAGVVRKSKNTMSADSTIFRLLKVPKYAKRTLAAMCEQKNEEMEKELNEIRRDWIDQEREIEWLRGNLERAERELERVKGELRDAKGGGNGGYEAPKGGQGVSLTEKEADELSALWDACGGE